jgi:hypothetical protein
MATIVGVQVVAIASVANAQEAVPPFRFFGGGSVWNRQLSGSAVLDASSAGVVGVLDAQVVASEQARKGVYINTTAWSVPVYTVPAGQPTVRVLLNKANASRNPLQAAWAAVPLPAGAVPAKGTDRHLVVWQPSTDKLWEFWAFEWTAAGPAAQWGGAMANVSQSSGAYDLSSWPGANVLWGASASSLSIAGGLITLEDLEKGQINHALAMAVPNPRAGVFAAPAQRTDGWSTEPMSLPEGAHLRLDPNLDLASLHLPRLTLMLAEAAQRYGIIVRDTASNLTFYAQDPTPTGTNPYAGANGFFEGKTPQQITAAFPWNHLQLLKPRLRRIHRGRHRGRRR